MKIMTILFAFLGFALTAQAKSITVHCEGDLTTMQFTMIDETSIQDYAFAFKDVPELKGEIKSPQRLARGLYDVNPKGGEDQMTLQIPPYATREDVPQFMVEYAADLAMGAQVHHYRDDVFCVKE